MDRYWVGDKIEVAFEGSRSIGTVMKVNERTGEYRKNYSYVRYTVKWESEMPWTEFDEASPVGKATRCVTTRAEDIGPDNYEID